MVSSNNIIGDFRMTVGENPRKVYNIVQGQLSQLQNLYRPVIDHLPNVAYAYDDKLQVASVLFLLSGQPC